MGTEIERKFLVVDDFINQVEELTRKAVRIKQGYLSSVPERIVRVRIWDDQGFITIKGKAREGEFGRFEWEKEISLDEAEQLMALCESGVIDKVRYLVDHEGHTFEVDVFYGDNEGLVVAELELESEDAAFEKPVWLGKEVTYDERYQNSSLTKRPFKVWK